MSPRSRGAETIWKQLYFLRYGTSSLFTVETEEKVAKGHDSKWPRGTRVDNSMNLRFNRKLYDYFDYRDNLRVLDLGCSGGGFVRSFLEDGFHVVLEKAS
jgi:2-polyprenyl-3-methyl-5-hydroxy-6-metoxy-1,4-benzoquinol methylase